MQSPLVVDALRDQLLQNPRLVPSRYPPVPVGRRHPPPQRAWQAAVRAITPQGESLLLSEPLLDELVRAPAAGWRSASPLENRRISDPHPWLDALARPNRPPLVEALAVYFDPDTSNEEKMAFQAMAGC